MSALDDLSWDQEVRTLLPPDRAADLEALVTAFLKAVTPGYRQETSPARAAKDLLELSELRRDALTEAAAGSPAGSEMMGGTHRLVVTPSREDQCTFRLRRFGLDGIELTRTLPLLESFGLIVVESVPFRLADPQPGADEIHIDDIGIRLAAPFGEEALRFVPELHGPRLVEAIEASARGDADVDSLNRLVTGAALDWRQVTALRAYLRYWHQVAADLTWNDLIEPLAGHPDVARSLVAYFQARFDPHRRGGRVVTDGAAADPSEPDRGQGGAERALVVGQLDLVTQLGAYRVLRAVLGLIDATRRTNFFSAGYGEVRPAGSARRSPLVIKFSSPEVPELAPPRPLVDTFVHGPEVEGIHLRSGLVARGGLRWSERPADFRTEVLDLAMAQVKKNAIIVPTGAKGGFVVRGPAHPSASAPVASLGKARPGPEQVRAAYEQFVSALLEITDNIVAGEVVAPPGVVAWDGPDPYLVVAADKGTATFSDVANAISERAGFWLGDAFASGGSRGYDHKAMGITARGAWVAVRRHFRELGVDVATDPIRVVGVGDMSGDVFGNGMLQSRAIRLVAAFDHRHVFLDPDPDGDSSYEERSRLAGLDRSSWADYRPEVISPGGGVWSRDTRVVPLSAEAQSALGVTAATMSPPELVSAILSAPVDLIWFGGIGTFIKAPGEADAEVGDHADDGVRITTDLVRARVIAEGANLAVTQRARIRYSRRGGRINADFIDNAAGVATSDREVNIKILLALASERGRLDPSERDAYLQASEAEVAAEVLRQVDHSVAALNRAASRSDRQVDAYEALIDDLEAAGRFDRRVEELPDREEFSLRRSAGAGLIRPELATILAYAKADLVDAIEGSERARDPVFLDSVVPYFPGPVRDEFADLVPDHRLYPQLVATDVAGELVDQMGIVWAHDLAAELGRTLSDVAAAFWVARDVTGAGQLWRELEDLAGRPGSGLSAPAESALHGEVARAVDELARTYLREGLPFKAGAVLARDSETAGAAGAAGLGDEEAQMAAWAALGISYETADRFLEAGRRAAAVGRAALGRSTHRSSAEIGEALLLIGDAAGINRLAARIRDALDTSPPPGRIRVWQARSLLDDLGDWRARAVVSAFSASPTQDPETAVRQWTETHAAGLSRAAELSAGAPEGCDPLALAALTLRRLVPLVGAG